MSAKVTDLCEAATVACGSARATGFALLRITAICQRNLWIAGRAAHYSNQIKSPDGTSHQEFWEPIQIADLRDTEVYREGYPMTVVAVDVGGNRSLIAVPMFKENVPIGVLSIYRKEVRPFTDKHIELVTKFAAKPSLPSRTRGYLVNYAKYFQQQTATSDVLKAISRSAFDLKTVLDALVEAAARLCEADQGGIGASRTACSNV